MHRLVYVSEVREEHPLDLQHLIHGAANFNAASEVTGALWFDGNYFIQLLEGAASTLRHIFDTRIVPATAHKNIRLLGLNPCEEKVFSDWSMAYLSNNSIERNIAQKFMADKGFNPQNCTADDIVNMLCYLEENRQRSASEAI